MAPLPLRLKIKPQTLALSSLRPFSSSPFPYYNPKFNGENDENLPSPKSSHASFFSDIKERLRSPPSPPRRIPNYPPPPPPIASPSPIPATSFDEVRKHLRASPSMPSPNPNPPSQDGPNSIRDSLRQSRPSPWDPLSIGLEPTAPAGPSLIGDPSGIDIPGEMREKRGEKVQGEEEAKKLRTEFVDVFEHDELGEKLWMLNPEKAEKGGKDLLSLEELKLRGLEDKETELEPGGLRELEDKETELGPGGPRELEDKEAESGPGEPKELEDKEIESGPGGLWSTFGELRESLMRIRDTMNTREASNKFVAFYCEFYAFRDGLDLYVGLTLFEQCIGCRSCQTSVCR